MKEVSKTAKDLHRLINDPRSKYITITEQQIADARDNTVAFPTHKHYVAHRFLKDHGLKVIAHEGLFFFMSPNEKSVMYVGEIGITLTARING
jgi:hypothetical protein